LKKYYGKEILIMEDTYNLREEDTSTRKSWPTGRALETPLLSFIKSNEPL